jgi:hypothetical protein
MRNGGPVTLELGGKSPNIVFADAHFETTIAGVRRTIFANAGQAVRGRTPAGLFYQRDIYINNYSGNSVGAPFDGYRQSGFGRAKGMEALHSYTGQKCARDPGRTVARDTMHPERVHCMHSSRSGTRTNRGESHARISD